MPTWIVVEDEPDLYAMVLSMYETLGLNGIAFPDGTQAIKWIDAVDSGQIHIELPELALLDIRLPDSSGADVSARLRQSPILGKIGIVLMTAYRLSPRDEKAIIAYSQADFLLYKPLPQLQDFYKLMQNILNRG